MSSDDIGPLLDQARTLVKRDALSDAEDIYRQVLTIDQNSVPAHEGLALVFFRSGRQEDAAEEFRILSELERNEARHLVNMGAVYNKAGDFKKAVDALRKALQRDRHCAEGYYNLGIAYRNLSQLAMAVSAYREAIRLSPQMHDAHTNLGNLYLQMGNANAALREFTNALEIKADSSKAKAGLELATQLQQKQAESPFGRLIDTAKAPDAAPAMKSSPGVPGSNSLSETKKVKEGSNGTQLVISFEIPESISDGKFIDLLDEFMRQLDWEHRAKGGHGLKVSHIEAEEFMPSEVPLNG